MNEHNPNDPLERRLESLGRALPGRSPDFTRSVLRKLAGEPAGNVDPPDTRTLHLKRWIMRGTLGLAASVLIGAFAWTLLVNEPQPAYGIADVRQQLAGLQSIRIAGRAQDGSTFEIFAERPDRSYRVQRTVRTAMTSDKRMVIDDAAKTAVVGPSSRFDARFMTEMVLQNMLVDQLLGPGKERLRKVRSVRLGDVDADVYESVVDTGQRSLRSEVFLNPRTGLPIKSVVHLRAGDRELPMVTFDQIEPNAPAPPGAFDFNAPAGYALTKTDTPNPDMEMIGGGASGKTRFTIRYAIEVAGGRAMLVCWSLHDLGKPADDLQLPAPGTMTITGPKSPYAEHTLRTSPTPNGHHWRWSLLTPTDPAVRVADNPPNFQIKTGGSTLGNTTQAVRFDRDELPQLLLDAQRRTPAADQQPLTLDAIESHLTPTK